MNATSTDGADATCTPRSLLKLAAAGAGVAGLGPALAACDRSRTPARTVRYWSYVSESDRAPEDKWFALFPKAVPGATVQKVFVPPDQMTQKVIGSAASRS